MLKKSKGEQTSDVARESIGRLEVRSQVNILSLGCESFALNGKALT